MKHSKKYIISSFLVGASFVFLNIPCFSVSAIEISVGEQAGIDDYLSAYGSNQHAIEIDYRVDEDGNRDAHVSILALQRVALNEQTKIYDNMDFSIAPSSVTVSGSGTYGYYKTTLDNDIHFGTWTLSSQNLFSSDSINLIIDTGSSGYTVSNMRFRSYITATNVLVFNILSPNGAYGGFTIYDSSGYMGRSRSTTGGDFYLASLNANNAVPTIPAGVSIDVYSAYGAMTKGAPLLSLPSGSVDTPRPWDYYNNVLLPYIENNYGDIIDYRDFLVFPDGYEPPAQPSTVPVEYPTSPTFDLGLIEDGTQPTGAETANYELPQFETKTVGVPVFDLNQFNPTQIIAPVSRGLSGIWALVTDILNSFGLFPLVTLSLLVSVIGALLLLGK